MSRRRLEVFRTADDGWMWRIVGANNSDTLADSGESYVRRVDCLDAAAKLFPGMAVDYPDEPPAQDGAL